MLSSSPVPSSVFTALIHCLHCLMEEILHYCRNSRQTMPLTPAAVAVSRYTNESERRQVGADVLYRDADLGCPSLCHLEASVRSTPQQELSTLPACPATLSAIPFSSSLPSSLCLFFFSLPRQSICSWLMGEVEAAAAKQIYSGLQQSLLERRKGERERERGENTEGGYGQKIVPSGSVWKKSKRTSFGCGGGCLAACLPRSHSDSHTNTLTYTHSPPSVPSGPLLLIEAWFGVPAPADPLDGHPSLSSLWNPTSCLYVIERLHTEIR